MATKVKEVINKLTPSHHGGSKVITVFGATGNQGGSVIRHIQAHPQLSKEWTIRAVTRDVSKPKSLALKEAGAELVTADLNDEKSVLAAIKGSTAVFAVTNYWEKMDEAVEIQQGKNLVDAAKEAKVEHFIWSSLPYVSKATNGKLTGVIHFDSKAKVEEYARAAGIPATYFQPGIFMEGTLQQIRPNEQGGMSWHIPYPETTRIPYFAAAADSGLFVAAILLAEKEVLGTRVLAATKYYTPQEMAAEYEAATGKPVSLVRITYEQLNGTLRGMLPAFAADELTANFQLIEEPGYFVGEPADGVDKSVALVARVGLGAPTTFKQFIEKNVPK